MNTILVTISLDNPESIGKDIFKFFPKNADYNTMVEIVDKRSTTIISRYIRASNSDLLWYKTCLYSGVIEEIVDLEKILQVPATPEIPAEPIIEKNHEHVWNTYHSLFSSSRNFEYCAICDIRKY